MLRINKALSAENLLLRCFAFCEVLSLWKLLPHPIKNRLQMLVHRVFCETPFLSQVFREQEKMITKLKVPWKSGDETDALQTLLILTDRVIQKKDNLMYHRFPRQEYLTEVWLKVVVWYFLMFSLNNLLKLYLSKDPRDFIYLKNLKGGLLIVQMFRSKQLPAMWNFSNRKLRTKFHGALQLDKNPCPLSTAQSM